MKKISTLNSGKLSNVLAQVLNNLITDTAYGVEYKQSKEIPAAGEVTTVKEPKSKSEKQSGKKSRSKKSDGKKSSKTQESKLVPSETESVA